MERNRNHIIRWFWQASAGQRWALALIGTVNVLQVAVALLLVYTSKRLIDIATHAAEGDMFLFSVLLAAVLTANILLSVIRSRAIARTGIKLRNTLRLRLFSHLINAYTGGSRSRHSGDTINRLEVDVKAVSDVLSSTLPHVVSSCIQFAAAFAFLLILSPKLAWSVVGIMPVAIVASKLFFRKMRRLTIDIRESDSKVNSHLQESLQNVTLIQSMEQEDRTSSVLSDLQGGLYSRVMRKTNFSILSSAIVGLAFAAGYATSFLWGVHGIMVGTVTFGAMTAFLQLVGQLQRPVVDMSSHIPAIVHAVAGADRLRELEADEEDSSGSPIHLDSPAGIRIQDVSFTYPEGSHRVLEGFSHDFTPGSRSAIIGPTGAGKSTIIRLMLALLRPQKGSIEIYDNQHSVAASPSTRCNFVYVPQGNSLLSGTIRDNLLLGDPYADEERMKEALHTAAAEFVLDLPQGLDTPCSEKGGGLSEGQAQRIAIARGLLRRGSILLLDEFSSSLDGPTEEQLMRRLTSNMNGRTMIFITHRERITEYCDSIVHIHPNHP